MILMVYEDAVALAQEILAPLPTDEFFDLVGRACLDVKGHADHPRTSLFGSDPKRTVLSAFATHSSELDCHAKSPSRAAPVARPVSSPDEFLKLIESFHERGYTVRVPDVVPLSPRLQRFARALEFLLHQPVGSSLFWSKAGADAAVHYDKRDNLIVQLEGRKRWFISTDAAGLQNNWKQVGEPLPHLQRHRVVDVGPGDLIYIPRGTPHTVESTTDSLHLAILFVPITLRDVMIAAIDRLSDNDRMFRETAVSRVDAGHCGAVAGALANGLSRLQANCGSEEFVRSALDLRSARMIGDLPALSKSTPAAAVTRNSRVRQSSLAICHVRPSFDSVDFSQPGGHVAVHPGVDAELRFIASTASFRVADMPGQSSDEVKIALVNRLVASGFLELET
jgi:mannose-6-phosphate isomerase-like protein (cupin superfamily)